MSRVNWELFEKQKTFLLIISILAVLFDFSFSFFKSDFPLKNLKVNVNTATKEELISVPYIGEKNVLHILHIREQEKIKDLDQLKNVRFYSKFKYFLRTE